MATSTAPVPPQNLDAEESVLGAILLDDSVLDNVAELVTPADFYRRESHGELFAAALSMHERGEKVDAITLVNELEKRGKLETVGGRVRVHELAAMVPATANAPHYARIVREMAAARSLIDAGHNIARLGWERPGDVDALMAQAETELSRAVGGTIESQFESLSDGLDKLADEIREAYKTGSPKMGLLTDFTDLDEQLTGFHEGQLILIAARPGMGKSALAQNIAENVADRGLNVGFATLEMSKVELQLRSLARASQLDSKMIRTGRLGTREQAARLGPAIEKVRERAQTLRVLDSSEVTPTTLRAQIRRLQRQAPLSLVVVDYLQLMLASRSEDSRQQEISTISRSLKLLARELGIPIIALSQLNRNLESRQEKRPMLSDLRESGSLEQDADVVLFVYRDDYYNDSTPDLGVAEIIVAKNRQGERGTVKLTFTQRITTFKNLPREEG